MKLFPETLKSCEKLQEANRNKMKSSLTTKNADATQYKRADSNVSQFASPDRGSAAKSINYEVDNDTSPPKAIPMIRMSGEAGYKEDKNIAEFMKYMNIMENQRQGKANNSLFSQNYRKNSFLGSNRNDMQFL